MILVYLKKHTLPVTNKLAQLLSLHIKLAAMVPCSHLPQLCTSARNKKMAIILQCQKISCKIIALSRTSRTSLNTVNSGSRKDPKTPGMWTGAYLTLCTAGTMLLRDRLNIRRRRATIDFGALDLSHWRCALAK